MIQWIPGPLKLTILVGKNSRLVRLSHSFCLHFTRRREQGRLGWVLQIRNEITMTTIPTSLPFSSRFHLQLNPRRLELRFAPDSNRLFLFNARASLSTTPSFPLASRIVVKSKYRSGLIVVWLNPCRNLGRLSYLGSADLPFSTNESDLRQEFSNFGEVAEGP